MSKDIHIAGLALRVGPLVRQRCAWCGIVLLDFDLNSEASPDPLPPWDKRVFAPDTLVRLTVGAGFTELAVVQPEPDHTLPLRCCAVLTKLVALPSEATT
jgi:hypothetical protein